MNLAGRRRLRGVFTPPGDKSISHRAALLASLARGTTEIERFAPGDDCRRTLDLLEALGVKVERRSDTVRVTGNGLFGLSRPSTTLDAGNSGSTIRMALGILAAQSFDCTVTGDASLRRRPMLRVVEPLVKMGAAIDVSPGGRAPLSIHGGRALEGCDHELGVASAQVKTALIFAGLHAEGRTRLREPLPSRDHTERLLRAFGANARIDAGWILVPGKTSLTAARLSVPGDLSSAAFFVVAASLLPGSDLVIRDVGLNPTRTGFLDVLSRMGARFEIDELKDRGGEIAGCLRVQASALRGTRVPAEWAPRLIDEIPVLAVAAAFAQGETLIEGVGELRHKESDRLGALAAGLRAMGAQVEETADRLVVRGEKKLHAASLSSGGDHRMAMAWAVASIVLGEPCPTDGAESVSISYPGFFRDLERLAA